MLNVMEWEVVRERAGSGDCGLWKEFEELLVAQAQSLTLISF